MGANLGGRAMEAGFGLNKGAHGFKGNQLENVRWAASKAPTRTSQGPKGACGFTGRIRLNLTSPKIYKKSKMCM